MKISIPGRRIALAVCLSAATTDALTVPSTTRRAVDTMWGGRGGDKGAAPFRWRSSSLGSSASSSDDDVTSLNSIRSTLIRLEETIIFGIIERSQFCYNSIVYGALCTSDECIMNSADPSQFGDFGEGTDGSPLTFLEYMLIGTEDLHAKVRRYTSPDEHAFFPNRISGPLAALPSPESTNAVLSDVGGAADINFNDVLLLRYIREILPSITEGGDDDQHGSTVVSDVIVLQALSKRVHYGKFVAESKYQSDPEGYQRLVEDNDVVSIMAKLTNEKVEQQVLRRARLKATTYGQDPLLVSLPELEGEKKNDLAGIVAVAAASAAVAAVEAMETGSLGGKVNPSVIEGIYRDIIIPMTKDIEVAYLFKRCGRDPPEGWYGGM